MRPNFVVRITAQPLSTSCVELRMQNTPRAPQRGALRPRARERAAAATLNACNRSLPLLDRPGDYIAGRFVAPAPPDGELAVASPADLRQHASDARLRARARRCSRRGRARRVAAPGARTDDDARRALLRRYQERLRAHREDIALAIALRGRQAAVGSAHRGRRDDRQGRPHVSAKARASPRRDASRTCPARSATARSACSP